LPPCSAPPPGICLGLTTDSGFDFFPDSLFKEKYFMRCLLINNDGAGFADHIDVTEGTTVAKLFAQRIPHGRAEDYLIRVNRQPVSSDQVLQEGDRISITPTKIQGAA
jgi:hypothetical protein